MIVERAPRTACVIINLNFGFYDDVIMIILAFSLRRKAASITSVEVRIKSALPGGYSSYLHHLLSGIICLVQRCVQVLIF